MDERSPLFRAEATASKRLKALGEITLTQPVSFAFLTAAAAAIAAVVVGFLLWGRYTEHATVAGELVPDLGLVEIHSPQYGTIVAKHVREGQTVKRGDVLFVISSERLSSALGPTETHVEGEVRKRVRSLESQIEKLRTLERTERVSMKQMLGDLESEASHLKSMRHSQAERVGLAQQTLARYEQLRTHAYVSDVQLLSKQEDLLQQRSALDNLERERNDVSRQITDLQRQLEGLPVKYENQTAELERNVASGRQELAESEARRRILITAPEDGVATAILGSIGQVVDASKVLASIVPERAHLQADLYAPSRAVGFISVGDTVLLRYAAYPYQRFGHQQGTVTAVSRTALPLSQLTGVAAGIGTHGEPMYRITVDIASQAINAYGKRRRLRAGMIVEADVLQETRRLYEWVLDPLYTLTGKIR